jgi:NAD+ kinase
MILPDTMEIVVLVPEDSRATAWVSFDGRHRVNLKAGDSIHIMPSQFPVPTVCRDSQSEDWIGALDSCLGWNKRQRQKFI